MLKIDDLELSLEASRVRVHIDGDVRELTLAVLGEVEARLVIDALAHDIDSGVPLDDAIARAVERRSEPRHMQRHDIEHRVTLLDDTSGADYDDVAAALRTLVQLAPEERRTVAVLGEFDCDPTDFVEKHDAIGRLVVRLNVSKLVAIGTGARHLHSAAGLEGSWDGESVIAGTPQEAYDLLRDEIRENDVVLVKGTQRTGLSWLVDRLIAGGVAQ